jgi:hypothetical protein
VRAGAAVEHADAAGVDDEAAVGEPDEGHVGVAEHHGLLGTSGEHLIPPAEGGVDEGDFLVVAGSRVAEQGRPEAVDVERDRQGKAGEVGEKVGGELPWPSTGTLACRPQRAPRLSWLHASGRQRRSRTCSEPRV